MENLSLMWSQYLERQKEKALGEEQEAVCNSCGWVPDETESPSGTRKNKAA